MRYFFLTYALVIVFVISVFGFRGDKFKQTPIRIFPDMDEQDYIKAQQPNQFFKNDMGAQQPVENTVPLGHTMSPDTASELSGYGNKTTYLHTGLIGGTNYGTGFPEELELKASEENQLAFLTRGKEVYGYKCAVCHGVSGNGKGIVTEYGFNAVASLTVSQLGEGNIYDVVNNGRGLMGQLGTDMTLYDRWAVVAYVKALQEVAKTEEAE